MSLEQILTGYIKDFAKLFYSSIKQDCVTCVYCVLICTDYMKLFDFVLFSK